LQINPDLEIFEVSCKSGEGLSQWMEWLISGGRKQPV
jgi:Ni2+-binding GTPase involved in maturation of urease and hydrogenase